MTTRVDPGGAFASQAVATITVIAAALGMVAALLLRAAPEVGLVSGAWIGFIFGLGIDEMGTP